MLRVVKLEKIEDLLPFTKISKASEKIFVCPDPYTADSLRSSGFKVVTITKFISDELLRFYGEDELKKRRKDKSELLLHLATIYKAVTPNFKFESFMHAYNLFSELRSFTTSLEVLSDALEHFPHEVAQALQILWGVVNDLGLIDEHSAYSLLAESYREIDYLAVENREVYFWGFGHLNAGQIDLIQALGNQEDIFIPLPKQLVENSRVTDWIHWLKTASIIDAPVATKASKYKAKLCLYDDDHVFDGIRELKNEKKLNIILAERRPSLNILNAIPIRNIAFKADVNPFDGLSSATLLEVQQQAFALEKEIKTIELLDIIENFYSSEMSDEFLNVDFKKLKILHLLMSITSEWFELSSRNKVIKMEDYKLLVEVFNLRMPRTYFIPISQNPEHRVAGLEEIDRQYKKEGVTSILCVGRLFDGFSEGGESFSAQLTKILASIGHVKNPALDLALKKLKIKNYLQSSQTFLMIEKSVLEKSMPWKDLVQELELDFDFHPSEKREGNANDPLKKLIKNTIKLEKISATRLQTYIDCPRKYYFKYILNLSPYLNLETIVSASELGQIQHKILEIYFGDEINFQEKKHLNVCKKVWESFLKRNKTKISMVFYRRHFSEILRNTKNGIFFLTNLKRFDPSLKLKFEVQLSGEKNGFIDCLVFGEKIRGILDFKRGAGSIPSASDVKNMKKIQILFYANSEIIDWNFLGYINLTSIGKSLLYTDEALKDYISEHDRDFKIQPLISREQMESYNIFENKTIEKMARETLFSPDPAVKACDYCEVKNLCPKKGSLL